MRRSSWFFGVCIGGLAAACGGVTTGGSAVDAGEEGSTALDASPRDASHESSAENADGDAALGRCPGSTYTSGADGGACDPARIQFVHVRGNACLGPTVGTFCDIFQASVPKANAGMLPPGFVCGGAELGVVACRWSFGDTGAGGFLDQAALDAACAVTAAFSQTTVECVVYE